MSLSFQNLLLSFVSAKCDNPLHQTADASLRVFGYNDPALEGADVTLSCYSELVLIGPTSLTCTSNGEWRPDSRNVECIGMSDYVLYL